MAEECHALLAKVPALAQLDGQRLLVTGLTGFFGGWLLALFDALHRAGIRPTVVGLSRDPARFLASQPWHGQHSWLTWHAGDVRDTAWPDGKFDRVLHAATDSSAAGQHDRLALFDQIVGGTRRVMEFAAASGARRVLLTGSGSQYGPQPADCVRMPEDSRLACYANATNNAYGEAKRAAEMVAALSAERTGIEIVFTRCYAFVGAGLPLDAHFAIGNFIRDALWRPDIVVNARADVWRSYLYGADLALWLLALLVGGEAGVSYHVGSDVPITIADLATRVRDLLAPAKSVTRATIDPTAPPSRYVPEIVRARAMGLGVWTPLDDAILRTARAAQSMA